MCRLVHWHRGGAIVHAMPFIYGGYRIADVAWLACPCLVGVGSSGARKCSAKASAKRQVPGAASGEPEDWVALQTRHGEGQTRHKRKVLTTAINRSIMMSRQL